MTDASKKKTPKPTRAAGDDAGLDIPLWVLALIYGAVTLFLFRAFVFSGEMLFGADTEGLGYMARAFYAEELRDGNFPLWNPLLLGGTPFLESLAGGDSLYPLSAPLLILMEPFRALGWKLVLHVFLAGLAMYGWTRALDVSKPAAAVAGLGYMVAPFMVTLVYPAHDGKIFVTALTPAMFWAVDKYMSYGRGRAWAATAGVIALVTLTTHFQMAYFLFLATGIYAFFRLVQLIRSPKPHEFEGQPDRWRASARFGLFLVASLVGAGAAGVQLLPAVDYIRDDSRRTATTTAADPAANKEFAASWSMHPEEAMSLVIPEFVGNSTGGTDWTTGTYWGRNVFKLNHEYIGIVLLVLAGLSFFGAPRRGVLWFMAGLFGVSLLYTLGANTPVWHLFYHLLPGIDLFRAASMAIFLTGFAAITLAAFGMDRILGWAKGEMEPSPKAIRYLWGSVAVVGVILVGVATDLLFSIWTAVLYSEIEPGKVQALDTLKPYIVRGAFFAILLVGGVVGAAWAARKRILGPAAITGIVALLVLIDGVRVDAPFIRTRDFDEFAASGPLIDELVRRQGEEPPFRVIDMNGAGEEVRAAMFGLELSTGHHPNDLARYRELIGKTGGGAPQNLLGSTNVVRLTNSRYMIWPAWRFGDAAQQLPIMQDAEIVTGTQLQDGSPYEILYRFDDLPRARLVANVEVVDESEGVARLLQPGFPLETTALAYTTPALALGGGEVEGEVRWTARSTDGSTLNVTTDRAALLVVSDNWVDAWEAAVNGVPAELLRVNHTQLGIPVPAGTHEVVIRFESRSIATGLWLTAICLVLMFVVTAVSFVRPRAPRPAEEGWPEDRE